MAYKQSPFPSISGTSGHRSALKQVEEDRLEPTYEGTDEYRTVDEIREDAEKGKKTVEKKGTTIFGKTLSEWSAIISKYAGKPNLSATAQKLLSKARNAVSKLKE